TFDDPLDAANDYYHTFTHVYAFTREKAALLSELQFRVSAGENYIQKNSLRLSELGRDSHYKTWADLIMANLHAIAPGAATATVDNFYDNNRPVEIKLKKDVSPQKTAELFYKKAKNQHIEVTRLQEAIREKTELLD